MWSLIALTMIDFDHQLLPDNITLPLLWLGLLVNTLLPAGLASPGDAVLGAGLGYLSLWSLYWAFKLLTGKEGMGYGDFKLLAALGAWMGWQSLLLIVILSSLVGAIVGISLLVLHGRDRNIPIPFGPYLAGAGAIALLWGETLQRLYLQWMT
jgi:leader peptidase (prepilin peptidase)/N-methyltransferase